MLKTKVATRKIDGNRWFKKILMRKSMVALPVSQQNSFLYKK